MSGCDDSLTRATLWPALLLCLGVLLPAGCEPPEPPRLDANTLLEIEQLRSANRDLRRDVRDLERQVETLTGLGDKRMERLYQVRRIRLGSITGGAEFDDVEGDDGVKVAVSPIDQHGSVIKAVGSVRVRVMDLAALEDRNIVAECEYDANATAERWFGGMFGGYYGFECNWPSGPPAREELTVRVEFTEYLSGKTFAEQKTIRIDLPKPKTQPARRPKATPNE